MKTLLQDILYSARTIRRNPGVVAAALVSLALGIGANVTIFSVADVFMFRPLPYEDADRLLHVYSSVPDRGWSYNVTSMPDFIDIRRESRTMDVAATYPGDYNLSGGDRPERIEGARVSWNFFRVLRAQPVLGQGTKLAATGIAFGITIAAGVAKSLSIFLFGVNPYDPLTFVAVTLALFLSGVVATYLPARRATKIDPVDALRHE